MTISVGDTLPEANLLYMGDAGPASVTVSEKTKGRKVIFFGLPGAFTGTCTSAHVPSFMRTKDALMAKGVDEIICFATDTPHVMQAWGVSTGATAAGLTFMSDSDGSFTKALGLAFDAPPAGFHGRTLRHSMLVDDGIVTILNIEEGRGVCDMSGGENMLDQI